MKNGFKLLSASALFTLALTTFSDSVVAGGADVVATPDFKYMPRFSTGPFYQTHNGAFGLYDLFLPYTIDTDSLLFVDGRYIDRGATHEYNIGAGYRSIASSGNFLWSLYTFFDDRKSRFNNYFKQITVGADFQTDNWYFNTNGYIPVGKTQAFVGAFNTAILSNQRIYYARGIERSMGGWDAEVGRTIWGGLKGYVGAYVFARSGVKTAAGPNVRLEYDIQRQDQHKLLYIFDKIVLIGNYRTDNLVGTTWYGGARFDIGFGAAPKMTILQRKMTSFIRRDINVELSSDGKTALHQPFNVLRNTFDGAETVVHQDSTAAQFDADIGGGSNVNIIGVLGTIDFATAERTLLNNQVVEGGVYSFTRDGQPYSVQVGSNGAITRAGAGGGAKNFFQAAMNNTIENMGFTFTGAATGENTLVVHDAGSDDKGTLVIRNNTVANAELVGLTGSAAGTTSNVIITGNTVTNGGTASGVNGVINLTSGVNATGILNATIRGNAINSVAAAEQAIVLTATGGNVGPLSVSINDNTITTAGAGVGSPSVLLVNTAAAATATLDILGDVSGNTITNTNVGSGITFVANGKMTFAGDVRNNVFTGNNDDSTSGVADFRSAAGQLTVNGAFRNNTVLNLDTDGADTRVLQIEASGVGQITTFNGGVINNTITNSNNANTGSGIVVGNIAAGGIVNIRGFYGNSITSSTATNRANIILAPNLATSFIHVWIGDGRTQGGSVQLQNANNNATYTVAGGFAANVSINP